MSSFERAASSAEKETRIDIVLCSDDTLQDQEQFVRAVTPYLKISHIEFAGHCASDIPETFCVTFLHREDAVYLTLNGILDGERIQNYYRLLPWLSDIQQPLLHTLSSGKQVALVLLLETLLLDFEQIRLRFEKAEIRSPDTSPPTVSDSGRISSVAVPTGNPQPESEVDRAHTQAAVEAAAIETGDSNPHAVPKHHEYRIGLGTGGLYLSPDVWAPSVNLYVARVVKRLERLSLFLAADIEPISTFHIGDRPFRTMLFGGKLGMRVSVLERRRLNVALGIGVVTRVSRFKRDRYASAKWQTWADVGPGTDLSLNIKPWKTVGMGTALGIDVCPTARNIRIENGPKKRTGYVGLSANTGIYIEF